MIYLFILLRYKRKGSPRCKFRFRIDVGCVWFRNIKLWFYIIDVIGKSVFKFLFKKIVWSYYAIEKCWKKKLKEKPLSIYSFVRFILSGFGKNSKHWVCIIDIPTRSNFPYGDSLTAVISRDLSSVTLKLLESLSFV